ncbi:MAG: alpha/beta hydrolase [Chloroflexi bacterium]|nr:MAG: alpha/beta hydrolase [Chloroflexota bacterium]
MAVAQDKLHPKARAIVDQLAGLPRLPTMTPTEARGRPEPLAAAPEAVGGVTARAIPGPGGPLPIRVYRPKDALKAALVYFHGGGWVIGSLEAADGACRAVANRSRCVVISIGYRLAPETKFPGPVEDAYAAVRWVADNAGELRIDPARIAVGGSSAGGNLAAVAALVARDRGGPRIAFQLLSVPVTELSSKAESHREFSEGYGLTAADMEWFGRHYVRTEADADEPYASVLRADLHGLPPAFVITAECDPLRDDGEEYARRLSKLGIAARYKRYPGMFHGFMSFANVLPEASEAFDDAGRALREALS